MFIFAKFVQNVTFERSQFKEVGVAFSGFYLFFGNLLRVLEEVLLKL